MNYKTPGVYVEEIRKLPPSIAQVETAIPVFIGYTEKAEDARGNNILNEPKRITSMLEYDRFFGFPNAETSLTVNIRSVNGQAQVGQVTFGDGARSPYLMYYSLQLFFANGGGPCYIVSVGNYDTGLIGYNDLDGGLKATEKVDEITLIVFPDAQNLSSSSDYYNLYGGAIDLCVELKDRFTVMDVWNDPALDASEWMTNIQTLRNSTSAEIDKIKYSSSYFPNVKTILDYYYGGERTGDGNVSITDETGQGYEGTLSELKGKNNALYFQVVAGLRDFELELPPSSGMVGIYASVDENRGVWKAPANVNMDLVIEPVIKITDKEQRDLNVDPVAGKSINVIRSFTGRGPAIVWGSRTLAGNDNEWRYISVRRFYNMVEESVKNASMQFVFEPNDANTWTRIKSMIENFLSQQWQAGALMGASTDEAYFVKVGLNETMSELDIWEGRMIIEIGMAVVRPAEFIILKFSHKMLSET